MGLRQRGGVSMSTPYTSAVIYDLDGDSIYVEESPENDERPAELKECIVTIRPDGRQAEQLRLGPNAARELAAALLECFSEAPGAVVK